MPIDGTQQRKLFTWLRSKGVRSDCPACGHEGWQAGDVIAPPSAPNGGGTTLGGPNFPLVQIFCENCSYVMHFASTPMGLESHTRQLRDHVSNDARSPVQPEA